MSIKFWRQSDPYIRVYSTGHWASKACERTSFSSFDPGVFPKHSTELGFEVWRMQLAWQQVQSHLNTTNSHWHTFSTLFGRSPYEGTNSLKLIPDSNLAFRISTLARGKPMISHRTVETKQTLRTLFKNNTMLTFLSSLFEQTDLKRSNESAIRFTIGSSDNTWLNALTGAVR